jgi:hypothetical protein
MLAAAGAAAQEGSSQLAECDVAGFMLRKQQLPRAFPQDSSPHAAVLHTLQIDETASLREAPNVAATAAACMRNEACVMFTSDGFLIGVYRSAGTVDDFNAAIAREQQGGGALSWVPMQYCAGRWCGTWVATELEQQLQTQAASDSDLQVASLGDLAIANDQTRNDEFTFVDDVMVRFCALVKASTFAPAAGALLLPQQRCPRHCQVACCALFARGSHQFDSHNEFEQCAPNPCARGCSLPGNSTALIGQGQSYRAAEVGPNVLKRQYVRAASVQGARTSTGQNGAVSSNPGSLD